MKKTKTKKKINKKGKKTKIKKVKVSKKLRKKLVKKATVKVEKKLSYAEKKAENLNRMSNELIEKGRKRGFITYDEILKTFPDIENNILFLDELYEKFGVAGIDVLEG